MRACEPPPCRPGKGGGSRWRTNALNRSVGKSFHHSQPAAVVNNPRALAQNDGRFRPSGYCLVPHGHGQHVILDAGQVLLDFPGNVQHVDAVGEVCAGFHLQCDYGRSRIRSRLWSWSRSNSLMASASAFSRSGASTEPRYSPRLRMMMTRASFAAWRRWAAF